MGDMRRVEVACNILYACMRFSKNKLKVLNVSLPWIFYPTKLYLLDLS